MTHLASLPKPQLLELLAQQTQTLADRDTELQAKEAELQAKGSELESQREQLRQQDIALQTKDQTIEQLTQERDEYKLAFDKLVQQRFRNRSERYLENPDQLRLDFGDTAEAADAALGLAEAVDDAQIIPEHRRRKPRKKRDEQLPEHLPRYEVTAEASDETKSCPTHGERTLLPESMWDRTETLELERPKLKVRVTKYPKYACRDYPECGIASPERPTGIVEGNKYDSSIAAQIITGKYGYHLPLYRLQDYFAGSGWTPSRSTQGNILANVHFIIGPLLEFFRRTVQSDSAVGCDDTGVTLLYPKTIPEFDVNDPKQRRIREVFEEALKKNKPSINAKMWAYRGVNIPLNVFDFTVSRHRDGPELFFADYEGTLLGDCWHGFEAISAASEGRILRAACNSHARRKFEQSTSYPDDRKVWMRWYQQLYDIEDRGKSLSAEERLRLRQTEAVPIWAAMERWLAEVEQRTTNVILPKSDFAKALQYVRNHWVELKRYLSDGRLPMDNNETEQLMKQVALGRKNWLFVGSVEGGERNAGFLTLVSSALRNDLDVWLYVKDVLDQLLSGSTDYERLLPWNWAASHPEAIRQYRVEERRDRSARRASKRAARRRRKSAVS
jgi:transposase